MIGLGAFIGDYSGSLYEFNPYTGKYEDIKVLEQGSKYTDDSVLTCAVMNWLLITNGNNDVQPLYEFYKEWGNNHRAGYGYMFYKWLKSDSTEPYNSYGNGSGMRVSPVAYWARTMDECLDLAEKTALPTHNHPEGIKGAKAIAAAIFMARNGMTKEVIKSKLTEDFGYDLDRTVEDIRGTHKFDATCQVTVPEAIICFLDSKNFADCVRKTIWIGGDVDTIGAMACPIAEAYYGIPYLYQEKMIKMLDREMLGNLIMFNQKVAQRIEPSKIVLF